MDANLPAHVGTDGAVVQHGDLAESIREAHRAAQLHQRSAVEHAIRCGELLIQAKSTVKHGEWDAWLKENISFSIRSAQGYMRLADVAARDPAKAQRVAHLTLRQALNEVGHPDRKPRLSRAAHDQGEGAHPTKSGPTLQGAAPSALTVSNFIDADFEDLPAPVTQSQAPAPAPEVELSLHLMGTLRYVEQSLANALKSCQPDQLDPFVHKLLVTIDRAVDAYKAAREGQNGRQGGFSTPLPVAQQEVA